MTAPETRPTRWLIALAAMAAAVPLIPAALGRTVVDSPSTFDIGNQWIGFAAFVRDSYLAGRFPLWDPHDLCGTPFLAFAHTGSLYLPAVLAHLALPGYTAAAAVDIFLHLFLAAAGAFLFLRRDDRSRPAAFAGAIIYAFSGFVFGNINFPPSLHSAAWLPLWYAGAFGLLSRPRLQDAALAAGGLAAMVYGGDLEMVVYGGLGLGFAAGLKLRNGELRPAAVVALALSVAAGLLPTLPLLLPAVELQALSIRSGETFAPGVPPLPLLAMPILMLVPVPEAPALYPPNHGLDPRYLGAMALLLVVWALRSPRARQPLWAFPAAAVYFLLFYAPPMSRIFAHVPVLGGLIVPFRAQPALWLFLLLAMTRALDEWARGTDRYAAELLPGGRGGGVLMMVFAGGIGATLIFFHQAVAARVGFALLLFVAGACALRPGSRPTALCARRRYFLPLLLIFVDLYLFALACLPMTDPAALAPDPRAARFIAGTAGRERYFIYGIRGIIDPGLPYHLGLRLNADTIDSFTRLPPRPAALRLAKLYPALLRREDGRLRQYDQMALRDPHQMDLKQLDLLNTLNVRWLIGRFPWPHPASPPLKLEPVFASPPGDPDPLFIYRNDAARPRAVARRGGATAPVPVDHLAPDEVLVGAADGATVTLSESWYPGWRASIMGIREIRVEADSRGLRVFRSVEQQRMTMIFTPAGFEIGLWAGLASILMAALFLCLRLARKAITPEPS